MTQENPFADAFKSLESFGTQAPNAGLDDFVTAGQKQAEVLQEAAQVITESFQAIAKMQSDLLQQNAENAFSFFKEIAGTKDPRESASRQAEFAKTAFETATKDAQKIADVATQASTKAAELLGSQVSDGFTKMNEAAATAPKKAANKAA
jgi:phasin family protein